MKMSRVSSRAVLLTIAGFALSSCSLGQAVMPDGFVADGGGYPVEGNWMRYSGKPIGFGPYRTVDVEGWGALKTMSFALPGRHRLVNERREYRFGLAEQEVPKLGVHCYSSQWFARIRIRGIGDIADLHAKETPVLECNLALPAEDTARRSMTLWADGSDVTGELSGIDGGTYEVDSTRKMERMLVKSDVPTGYSIRRNGRIVMMVDVVNAGRVYFAPGLDANERAYMAAAASALLIGSSG